MAAVQKIAEIGQPVQENAQIEAPQPQKKPWARMDEESFLWYNRFRRYMKMGPKRSLQAAFEQERDQIKALESTKNGKKPPVRVSHKAGKLQEVKKALQVPGSWKQASIRWAWVERARAYDAWRIDMLVENHIDGILQDAALGIERVKMLKNLLNILQVGYNANHNHMTYEQEFACIARMQSILEDIRKEMSQYDESLTRILLRRTTKSVYENASLDELKAGKIEVNKSKA